MKSIAAYVVSLTINSGIVNKADLFINQITIPNPANSAIYLHTPTTVSNNYASSMLLTGMMVAALS